MHASMKQCLLYKQSAIHLLGFYTFSIFFFIYVCRHLDLHLAKMLAFFFIVYDFLVNENATVRMLHSLYCDGLTVMNEVSPEKKKKRESDKQKI